MHLILLIALGFTSCVMTAPRPWDIGHHGPGSVAVVFEREDEERGTIRELFVYRETGARRIVLPAPRSAQQFVGPVVGASGEQIEPLPKPRTVARIPSPTT